MKKTLKVIGCIAGYLLICFFYNFLASGDFENFLLTTIAMPVAFFALLIARATAKSSPNKEGWTLFAIILFYILMPIIFNFASSALGKLGYARMAEKIFNLRYSSLLIVPLIFSLAFSVGAVCNDLLSKTLKKIQTLNGRGLQ